jgi:hypothetical protein
MKTIFVIIASILLLSQNIDAQICDSLSVNDSLSKLNLSKTLIPDSAKHTRDSERAENVYQGTKARQLQFQLFSIRTHGHGFHGCGTVAA